MKINTVMGMSLIFTPHTSRNEPKLDAWRSVNKIQSVLDLTDAQMSAYLELSINEFKKFKQAKKDPPVRSLISLCDEMNLGFEQVVTGAIDWVALEKQFLGDAEALPEKYSYQPRSRMNTVQNLFSFVEEKSGTYFKDMLLKRFQLTNSALADPNRWINISLHIDITNDLLNCGLSENILQEIGKNAAKFNRNSAMGESLAKVKTVSDVYVQFLEELVNRHVEKNYSWRILKLTEDRCWVEGKPLDDLYDIYDKKYVNNYHGCLVRQGFLESLPLYKGHSCCHVTKHSCIAKGDESCVFEVDLSTSYLLPSTLSLVSVA